MSNKRFARPNHYFQGKQKGVATLLTVVLVLLMMSILALYGTRVGLFEQMSSSNDARQKQAFHAAEAGINMVIERIRANSDVILASDAGGWFAPATKHWLSCTDTMKQDQNHPCYAERTKTNTLYYVEDDALPGVATVSLGADLLPADQSVEVGAVLCALEVDYSVEPPIVSPGCAADPGNEMLITLVSRGSSDNGRGQAVVKQVIADYDIAAGVPAVALTAPFVGLPNGTADIVANPNGGGEGVPLSVWSRDPLDINGTLRTCEAYEFYDQFTMPDDISCPGCDCQSGAELSSKFTRYSDIRDDDESFPDDLFEYFFGVPKDDYESVKNSVTNVSGCGDLSASSSGALWVNGGCSISGNGCSIGSQENPVLLIVSGDFQDTGCEVYGLIFVTDAELPALKVAMNGQATVYGAVMVDHDMQQSNGTLAIVYNEDVLTKASTFNGIAAMPGGWSDFL